MGRFSVKGVLIGGVVDVASSVILSLPFAFYAMASVDLSGSPPSEAPAMLTAAIHRNAALYMGQLLVGLACSALGGYLAGWLAKHDELLNGALSSFLCVGLGIYTMATGKDLSGLWVQVLMLVASPLFALIGGDLMRRQRQHRALMARRHVGPLID